VPLGDRDRLRERGLRADEDGGDRHKRFQKHGLPPDSYFTSSCRILPAIDVVRACHLLIPAQAGIIPKISKPRFHEKSIDRAEPLDARTVRRANASSRVIAARRQGSQKDRALLYRIAKADAAAA
jgi:hypothetical protein